jgi:hypothetical protein
VVTARGSDRPPNPRRWPRWPCWQAIGCRRRKSPEPCWPTALALLAWSAAARGGGGTAWSSCIGRAQDWICRLRGETQGRSDDVGHDSTLVAWPWVEGTHSWIEPTALHVLALKAVGQAHHRRVREAIRLLIDRQLPQGGCNYGNTFVLGQQLRPHVHPTGLALCALVGEWDQAGRLARSLDYLLRALGPDLTPLSTSWAVLGLAAHQRLPSDALARLDTLVARCEPRGLTPHEQALLTLAGLQSRDFPQSIWLALGTSQQ